MTTVFIICAAVGGTVLVLQFIMALVGLGGHGFDIDTSVDVPHDFGGDFHLGDMHGGDIGEVHGGDIHDGDTAAHAAHGSTWFFGILSFRTVVAALAFFGLSGLAAESAEYSRPTVLFVALAAGAAALFAVYWMMRLLNTLKSEGTVRIQRSVGEHGNVYLRVPANRAGCGKIQFSLQNRTMEYLAVTAGPELPTGAKVVVTGIVNPTTLEVQGE